MERPFRLWRWCYVDGLVDGLITPHNYANMRVIVTALNVTTKLMTINGDLYDSLYVYFLRGQGDTRLGMAWRFMSNNSPYLAHWMRGMQKNYQTARWLSPFNDSQKIANKLSTFLTILKYFFYCLVGGICRLQNVLI